MTQPEVTYRHLDRKSHDEQVRESHDRQQLLSPQYASNFLIRKRRANSFLEEGKAGNLERECIEELCNREEAREIFENDPETEYFYPRYLDCLGTHRKGMSSSVNYLSSDGTSDLRSCVNAIPNQCNPVPCNKDGYQECVDEKGDFRCICKPGWSGKECELDINECDEPDKVNGGCNQRCVNLQGSYRCACEDGYYLHADKHTCLDFNECELANLCGSAKCINTPGKYDCECDPGYRFNISSKVCEDVDECAEKVCTQNCVNQPGGYTCYCDGREKFKLAQDKKSCDVIPICVPLNLETNYELLYLAEQFTAIPVVYVTFKLPDITRFSAEFDFRTYDGEGVLLYAESPDSNSWLLLALRDGKIEIQFKNELWTKVTSGGKSINNGEWHIISVEEFETMISVKIAKEAVMNINNPTPLFKPINGILETKVNIAGLPRKVENLIKPINPRLDGCIRGWNLMNQGALGVKEVIQQTQSKHCLVSVHKGSYYPGGGLAQFLVNYKNASTEGNWSVNATLDIRSSTGTGVLFALVSGKTVPLALAMEDQSSDILQDLVVSVHNVIIARLATKRICTTKNLLVNLKVTKSNVELVTDSYTEITYSPKEQLVKQLSILDQAMKGHVDTYLGGIPGIPLTATPVSAFYIGCMNVTINDKLLDLDEAVFKQNDIRSHSCPLVQ
ncbi:vitamin K-dependent S [Pelobates cultripes]|uniref:Vitamin K-dependent protein S n=1 Tax=Pelobates cultripes TaxID=61616 RepID=A0AAD1QY44_PELCU|nr:vitamin K-dependent S [Pelobates cultripes]